MTKKRRPDRARSRCHAAQRAGYRHSAAVYRRLPAKPQATAQRNYLPQDMDRLTASYFLLDKSQMTAFAELLSEALHSEATGPESSNGAVTAAGSLLTISNAWMESARWESPGVEARICQPNPQFERMEATSLPHPFTTFKGDALRRL